MVFPIEKYILWYLENQLTHYIQYDKIYTGICLYKVNASEFVDFYNVS